MRYYLGIDNGGTNIKAAIFSSDGKQIASESATTNSLTPAPDFVEIDMEEMWRSNCRVIQNLLSNSGIDPKNISGIGVCGHGKGLYLWGKDNRPVRNGILSSDNRAWEYAEKWKKNGVEKAAFEMSCQHILSCQPICLLAWLRDKEPECIEKTQWVFECKDYIRFRLTQQARAEITDYSGSGLLNLKTCSYDSELLKLFGLQMFSDALPPICGSLDICGYVSSDAAAATGLCEGTPVIGGMFDIDACCLATGVYNEENICMIAGTWSINEYIRREPVTDGSVLMNSLFCIPGYYLVEESSPTSAGNLEWFIHQFLTSERALSLNSNKSVYDILNLWVEDISPDEFVPLFFPFLTASNVDQNARAAFLGLNASHTKKHLVRSIYEGVAFSHRFHFDKLISSRKTKQGHIRLAGGAARSAVWAQIFADVMGMPVDTTASSETGALGCSIAAAAALGHFPDMETAARAMCSVEKTYYPVESSHVIYSKKYELYTNALSSLSSFWPLMQNLINGK